MTRSATVQEADNGSEQMKPIINLMIQIQELTEARAQQETLDHDAHLERLNKSIAELTTQLPSRLKGQMQKLQKKGLVAIVPVHNNVCSGCGMGVPVSLTYSVKAAEQVHCCPNCTRLLYVADDSKPRRVAQQSTRFSGPQAAGIARFSSPALMMPELAATARDEAITEICTKMEEENFVDNGAKLAEESMMREAIASTAVDHGLAFPHVRGVEGGGLALALAISKKGFKFDESQRTLTRIIFFVSIPTAASAFYLKLLAGLTQSFREKKNRDKLLAAPTADKLWKALVACTRTTIK